MLLRMTRLLAWMVVGSLAPSAVWADGAVYAMTNALGNNEIKVYRRANDGTLGSMQTIATGGGGSGIQLDPTDSLGSQGGLWLHLSHRLLFAVNTESLAEDRVDGIDVGDCARGTISSFRVAANGRLTLLGRVRSGGLFPASLTAYGDLLYVLNAGGPGLNPVCDVEPNITGFRIREDGRLRPLAGSTRNIDPGTSPGSFLNCDPGGGPFPGPEFRCGLNPPAFPRSAGQISFTPDGDALVMTIKSSNTIHVYPIDEDGRPGEPTVAQNQGPFQPTYFGFAFGRRGTLIVSEPFGATPNIPAPSHGAASSFALTVGENGDDDDDDDEDDGEGVTLQAISSNVPTGRGTACWLVLDPRQRYAYVANNNTSDVSSFRVARDGSLTLHEAVAAAAHLPNDMAVAQQGGNSFLYVLNSGDGTVAAFRINNDGSLTSRGVVGGLPVDAGAQGLAAY